MPKAIKKKTIKPSKAEADVKNILIDAKKIVREKKSIFLPLFIVLVAIVISIAGLLTYRSSMNRKAAALEYEAYKTYYNLFQKQPLQKEEQYRMALEKFKKAYETRKTPFSLFYIASCYYDMGQYEEVLKTLKSLNEQFPDDERFVPLSFYKMAMTNIRKGDRDAALKPLDTIYNYKTGSFKDLAIIESARILDAMGKTAESDKKYEELTKNFPASPFIEEAKAIQARKANR